MTSPHCNTADTSEPSSNSSVYSLPHGRTRGRGRAQPLAPLLNLPLPIIRLSPPTTGGSREGGQEGKRRKKRRRRASSLATLPSKREERTPARRAASERAGGGQEGGREGQGRREQGKHVGNTAVKHVSKFGPKQTGDVNQKLGKKHSGGFGPKPGEKINADFRRKNKASKPRGFVSKPAEAKYEDYGLKPGLATPGSFAPEPRDSQDLEPNTTVTIPGGFGPQPGLVECRSCKRSFAPGSISGHEAVCRRLAARGPRSQYRGQEHRLAGTEAATFLGGGQGGGRQPGQGGGRQPGPAQDWRLRREEFVASLREARLVARKLREGVHPRDLPPPRPADTSHYMECPHCGRRSGFSCPFLVAISQQTWMRLMILIVLVGLYSCVVTKLHCLSLDP